MKIDVEVPLEQPNLQFRSYKATKDWAEAELEFWRPLSGIRANSPDPNFLRWDRVENSLQRVVAIADEKPKDAEERRDRDTRLGSAVREAIERLQLLHRDPRSQFLQLLKSQGETDAIVGATLLAFISPQRLGTSLSDRNRSPIAVTALAHRALFLRTPDPKVTEAFHDSVHAYEQAVERTVSTSQDTLLRVEEKLQQATSVAAQAIRNTRHARRSASKQFDSDLNDLRQQFRSAIALRAPTEYWSTKATEHEHEAKMYRNAFAGILVLGLVLIGSLTALWLLPALDSANGELWPIVIFSVLVAIWAWPLRLTSRLYLSHRHLHEDAAEREVITRTFLALNEEVDLTEGDRQMLLAALFRTSSAGLVKDEGGLTLTDMLFSRSLTKPH